MDKKSFSKESNIGYRDLCISCGHPHYPLDWKKNAGLCTVGAHDEEECSCTPKKFVGRSFKGQFA